MVHFTGICRLSLLIPKPFNTLYMEIIHCLSFRLQAGSGLRNPCVTLLFFLFCLTIGNNLSAQKKQPATAAQNSSPKLTYTIINNADNTFGYDIYSDGRLKIHQPSVPAMPGNKGFATKAAAEKVAQLAIKKMAKGESLPTISREELKKLKAI
jgi:hypothetical protein